MKVVSVYAAYVIASAAFDKLDSGATGVLQLKDLPNLMAEARQRAGAADEAGASEVSFMMGVCSTKDGDMSIADDDVVSITSFVGAAD